MCSTRQDLVLPQERLGDGRRDEGGMVTEDEVGREEELRGGASVGRQTKVEDELYLYVLRVDNDRC
jgi:hypothetical protein